MINQVVSDMVNELTGRSDGREAPGVSELSGKAKALLEEFGLLKEEEDESSAKKPADTE
jgi:molybdenum-dependent DNA-binding transcriptional regulator ModE